MTGISSFVEANRLLARYVDPLAATGGYSLKTMIALMQHLGNPQNSYQVIHVAGTSGKTSTCYYLADLLCRAGYEVGLTVSPHIDQVNERAQINMQPLPEGAFCAELEEFIGLVEASGCTVSYFEVTVAFAYWLFAKRKVDVAVVEVGLGGLLDGTNVVQNSDKLCVITDIGYDHTEILGPTLSQISRQKAGIILTGNKVFMYKQAQEIVDTVAAVAKTKNATLHLVDEAKHSSVTDIPPFQRRNFHLASHVVRYFIGVNGKRLSAEQYDQASKIHIPGRMEVVQYRKKTVLLDGSHNPQKLRALREGVAEQFSNLSSVCLFSLGRNKQADMYTILKEVLEMTDTIVLTKFSGHQDEVRMSVEPDVLADACRELGFKTVHCEEVPLRGLSRAMSTDKELIIVTGSNYLLSHLRPTLLDEISR